MSLFRIVYVSDAIGVACDSLLALIDIIGVSDRNNRRDQVTGVLMRHDGRFFQAVEGGRADLDRLMGRIRADSRHANIRILFDTPAEERLFAGRSMELVNTTPGLERVLADTDRDPDAARDRARRLLSDISRALAVA